MWGLRINERMAGWIQFDEISTYEQGPKIEAQVQYPFEFEINTFSRLERYPLPFRFTGVAKFPGLLPVGAITKDELNPPIAGTMQLSHRGVSYDFEMEWPGMGKVRIYGKKTYYYGPSWSKIRAGLVTLPLRVEKAGRKVGEGRIVYPEPLWKFPFGVRPTQEKYAYSPREKLVDFLLDLAPVVVPDPQELVDQKEARDLIRRQVNGTPYLNYVFFKLAAWYVKFLTYALFQKSIHDLQADQRHQLCLYLTKKHLNYLLTIPLITLAVGGVYGTEHYRKARKQHIPQRPQTAEEEPWMELVTGPTKQNCEEELEVDAVVVGSGAGGAAAAYQLARKGHAVLVLEEGEYFKRQDYNGNRIRMMERLYRASGNSFAISNSPLWIPTGKCVGGTTVINSGTCLRTPEKVLNRWEKNLGLSDLGLEQYFPEVEAMLDVKPVPREIQGGIRKALDQGLEKLGTGGLSVEPLLRAESGCDGQSYCILGCPIGAKRSTDVSYMKEALRSNAFLYTSLRAKDLVMEGGEVKALIAELPGYNSEFTLKVKAKQYVIAAGTFQTPVILKRAGFGKVLPKLGKNLTIHPALNVGALFGYNVRDELFVPQSLGVFGLEHGDFVLEGYTIPTDSLALAFQVFGRELGEIMENLEKFSNFASMIKDPVKGRLLVGKNNAVPMYYVNDKLIKVLKESAALLGEIFLEAGANTIYAPINGFAKMTSHQDLVRLKNSRLRGHDFILSAHHPLGTCRMGSDPKNSVVNRYGKVWGTDNLYVADGSVIPGPLGVNPQVTIMSNALRIADHIHGELS